MERKKGKRSTGWNGRRGKGVQDGMEEGEQDMQDRTRQDRQDYRLLTTAKCPFVLLWLRAGNPAYPAACDPAYPVPLYPVIFAIFD